MNILKQAHKLAALAMEDQRAYNTGNLLYSDFLGYYMKLLAKEAKQINTLKKSLSVDVEDLFLSVFIFVFALALTIGFVAIGIGFSQVSILLGLVMCAIALTFFSVVTFIAGSMLKDSFSYS